MQQAIFTVDQVAEMLDLHPKTVRRFIRGGKLKARKIGGHWRVTEQDIKLFMGEEQTDARAHDTPRKIEAPFDDVKSDLTQRVQVTSIVDVYVDTKEDALRISNTLLAIMLGKSPEDGNARFNHVYYEDEGKARFLLWGNPLFISKVLQCISEITK